MANVKLLAVLGVISVGVIASLAFLFSSTTYPAPPMGVLDENGTTPNPTPLGEPFYSETQMALRIHDLVNEYRIQNELPALAWSDGLASLAKSHSIDMNVNNYFEHDGPDGTVLERSQAAGFTACGDPEMVAMLLDYETGIVEQKENVAELNKMSDQYTTKQKQYENNLQYANKFNDGDAISNLRMQKEYSELNNEYQKLNSVEDKLRLEDKRLENLGKELDIAIEEHKVGLGVGENMATGFTYSTVIEYPTGLEYDFYNQDEISSIIVDGWINSIAHRENILNYNYQSGGIGISIDYSTNKVLITQDFC